MPDVGTSLRSRMVARGIAGGDVWMQLGPCTTIPYRQTLVSLLMVRRHRMSDNRRTEVAPTFSSETSMHVRETLNKYHTFRILPSPHETMWDVCLNYQYSRVGCYSVFLL